MALADYYGRAALAASQVVAGFDEALFRTMLERPVGVHAGATACDTVEGRCLVELTVRLIARLFPSVQLNGPDSGFVDELVALATAINPNIEIVDGAPVGIAVGAEAPPFNETIHAGSSGWDAYISRDGPLPLGMSSNPFGAAAAACFSCAELFKWVLGTPRGTAARYQFSTFHRELERPTMSVGDGPWVLDNPAVLVGVGAVGNAAAWSLARAPMSGLLHLVDPEAVELSNLQRYVLCERADEGRSKVEVAASYFKDGLTVSTAPQPWASFVADHGYEWHAVLVALDSARDRRAVQASLPGWIANAWTQPGDLGLSSHGLFSGDGACLSCLYLPTGEVANEDDLVATALGIPELVMEVRTLLHNGAGLPAPVAEAVARGLDLPADSLIPFVGRPIRELYVEGVCGGALIPLGVAGMPRQELHVPLAHQSALAGVLLAASLARFAINGIEEPTVVTRIDVLGDLRTDLTQPALKAHTGRCLCDDLDFVEIFDAKYVTPASTTQSET